MKRILLTLLLFLVMAGTSYSATIEAPDDFVMVINSSYGNTRIDVSFTNPAECDTIMIVLQSDSTLVFYMNASDYAYHEAIDTTITGLKPFTLYSWVARFDSSDTKSASNGATATTKRMNTEADWYRTIDLNEKGKLMYRFDSWAASRYVEDSITLIGASDTDSTIWYECGEYTSFLAAVFGHADSCKFTLEVWAGYPHEDETFYWVTLRDSLVVTAPGVFDSETLDIPPNAMFYIKAISTTDNDPNVTNDSTYVAIRLNRSDSKRKD